MSEYVVKLPDVGEGVAEAELINWLVAVGDEVTQETALAEVMTDKATVEISAPVHGVVATLHGNPGDTLVVGAPLVTLTTDGSVDAPAAPAAPPVTPAVTAPSAPAVADADPPAPALTAPARTGPRPTASPAVRARATSLGIDLGSVHGTGPDGRVLHADLDRLLSSDTPREVAPAVTDSTETVIGLRRRIAERLTTAWNEIPHITYVDAVDVTAVEELRAELNRRGHPSGTRLTLLPFVVRALVLACAEQPRLNATYDTATRALTTHGSVHVGIATQTPEGLMVPVLRDADARSLWDIAVEMTRVTSAAREGRASRAELMGSTISITSLGAIGGLVTTPLINQPEVAIIGVNKIETRPVWQHGAFVPRQMCNLSSSFDHRIVDGWDAATFVQRIKSLLEMPALLFGDGHW